MASIRCDQCGLLYPAQDVPFHCACGGVYDFDSAPDYQPTKIERNLPGLWRYRHTFDLNTSAPVVTLGEGNTPLIWAESGFGPIGLKLESLNPTGSYKDRGSAVLVSQLAGRGVKRAVEDSSGNAGASFAAYAARSGMHAAVYVPESASGPKRRQIEEYGADLIAIPGPRAAAAEAVLREAESGVPYASHAYLPFGLAGIATIAYELQEQAGTVGSVIMPVGHGGLFLGVLRGFKALLNAGLIDRLPYFVGAQAQPCAPVVNAANRLKGVSLQYKEGVTIAEGVRVQQPVRASAILRESPSGAGEFYAVAEEKILPACAALNHQGVYVEPTSALVWAVLDDLAEKLPRPIILILTGSGLKYNPIINRH